MANNNNNNTSSDATGKEATLSISAKENVTTDGKAWNGTIVIPLTATTLQVIYLITIKKLPHFDSLWTNFPSHIPSVVQFHYPPDIFS